MTFPDKPYADAASFSADYFSMLAKAAAETDTAGFATAAAILSEAVQSDRTIYACGNGGSAGVSNHLLCDFAKGIQTDTQMRPKVVSLSSHVELITAIGNDIAFDEIFRYQLQTAARPGDVLMTISSSGNSENIVRAVEWAKANEVHTICLTGFDGGRSRTLADANIHVPGDNYGVIEDLHQSAMHILAQFVRQRHMPEALIAERKF
jgi:phosphoheptose isomerase